MWPRLYVGEAGWFISQNACSEHVNIIDVKISILSQKHGNSFQTYKQCEQDLFEKQSKATKNL